MGEHACIICGNPRIAKKSRCETCYWYLWRHGVDRPEALVVRAAARRIEKDLAARVYVGKHQAARPVATGQAGHTRNT